MKLVDTVLCVGYYKIKRRKFMKKTKIFADRNLTVGQIDGNIYGSFLEHLGRAVYGGIYEPGHPSADKEGFREDVIALIRELGVPLVRYPGGNFVSGYDWKDGIGPKNERKARLDLAWASIEPNEFGTDEFIRWCRKAGISPMLAVNMGTGTPKDALELFEYCNHPSGTYYSDLRRKNGAEQPHGVQYWCLGNEMDGDWQICGLDAESYGKKAMQTARMLRWADGKRAGEAGAAKLVVCGSCHCDMPTYPEWDRIVLENTYEEADLLSMHRYYEYKPSSKDPLRDFLGSADNMGEFIDTVAATIEYVRAKKRSRRRVHISFDEWNVWNQSAPRTAPNWVKAPALLEDSYTFRDMLVVGGMLNTLLNHCNVVKAACLAQLVNVIAPIITQNGGGALRQTIFYPFRYASRFGRGETVRTFSDSARFENMHGRARVINEAVTHNDGRREVCAFLCNYSESAETVALELRDFGDLQCAEFVSMESADLDARNTFAAGEKVCPVQKETVPVKGGAVEVQLAPMSWNFLRFSY